MVIGRTGPGALSWPRIKRAVWAISHDLSHLSHETLFFLAVDWAAIFIGGRGQDS